MNDKITVSIRIYEKTKFKLKAIALRENLKIGELIESLLDGFLDEVSNDYLKGYVDFIKERDEKNEL